MLSARHIFFVGIKGVAMSNLARIAREKGIRVSGSDVQEHFITDDFLKDISVVHSFSADTLPDDVDLLVYAAAHGGLDNPQVVEAKRRGVSVLHQVELLNRFLSEYHHRIGIAGCHGKTTTTSLLAYALLNLGVTPGYLAGVSDFCGIPAAAAGSNDYFVVEADEYGMAPPQDIRPKFLQLDLNMALITNIDYDHPDVYKNKAETASAFASFAAHVVKKNTTTPCLVVCADDSEVMHIAHRLPRKSFVSYGFSEEADVRILYNETGPTGNHISIKHKGKMFLFDTKMWGAANALNTAGVIAMLHTLGFAMGDIPAAIAHFTGAKRRFEVREQIHDSYLIDDYAHHPEEIHATIAAARSRFRDKRIIVLFQPHTHSRTSALQADFISALRTADIAFVLPVFGSAREKMAVTSITSEQLVRHACVEGATNLISLSDVKTDIHILKQHIQKGDVIITMGAGNVYKHIPFLASIISTRYE